MMRERREIGIEKET